MMNIPIIYGPCKGQPRRNNTLIKLLDTTTIIKDYEKVAGMTLDKVETISRPTLALYGENSHFLITYEYMRDHLPNCKTVLLTGGDHYGPLEHPEMIIEHLKAFFHADNKLGNSMSEESEDDK